MSMWGPPVDPPDFLKFSGAPYAPFSKGDKLGKAADWAVDAAKDGRDAKRGTQHGRGGLRDPYYAYGASSNNGFFTNDDQDHPLSFSLVDSSTRSNLPSGGQGGSAVLKARGGRQQGNLGSRSAPGLSGGVGGNDQSQGGQQRGPSTRPPGPRTMTIGSATQTRGFRGPGAGRWGAFDRNKNREPSVTVDNDWTLVQSNNFAELQKLSYDIDISSGRELGRYGFVPLYDRSVDKITAPKRLRPVDRTTYNVTTSEDPVIQELATKVGDKPAVFATDNILALLMCAAKTNNPWDIIVHKRGKQIYLDKRDGGPLDFLTVDENAHLPPADQADNKMDSTAALSIEATYVNQNFSANVMIDSEAGEPLTFEHPNPFSDGSEPEAEPLLPRGYIYKSFNLESDPEAEEIPLIVRLEIEAALKPTKDAPASLLSVKALNEYGGARPLEWKQRFQSHRGAIVAAEMKNNLAKVSQWTTQALLAGVQSLKIGFVSRVNAKNKAQHEIVGVLTADPAQFASQLNLKLSNGWGIVKSICNIFDSLNDGTYVVMRDPNAPVLKIYSVPEGTQFEST